MDVQPLVWNSSVEVSCNACCGLNSTGRHCCFIFSSLLTVVSLVASLFYSFKSSSSKYWAFGHHLLLALAVEWQKNLL